MAELAGIREFINRNDIDDIINRDEELERELLKKLVARYGGAEVVRKDINAIYDAALAKINAITDYETDKTLHDITLSHGGGYITSIDICPNQILSNSSRDYCVFLCQLIHFITGTDFIGFDIRNGEVVRLSLVTRVFTSF